MQASRNTAILKFSAGKGTETLSLIAGAFLLILLLVMNYPSTGVVRSGDEGSGFGGTGRAAQPGSGLGGTGLKPFLGLNTQSEIEILHSSEQRDSAITQSVDSYFEPNKAVAHTMIEPAFQLVANTAITLDSSAVTIAETMQRTADSNALYFQQLQEISAQLELSQTNFDAQQSYANLGQVRLEQALELAALPTATSSEFINEADIRQAEEVVAIERNQVAASNKAASWEAFALFLSGNTKTQSSDRSSADISEISVTGDATTALSRPEKIQRPELPPVQRLRPIQRASILPPRVQPLRF